YLGNAFGDRAVFGYDFVGELTELGSGVTRLAKGDLVVGLIWGGELHERLRAWAAIANTPSPINTSHSRCRPVSREIKPVLFHSQLLLPSKGCLNLDRSQTAGTTVLVWAGRSSVGPYTVQVAAIYGVDVIATCSPHNPNLVRSSGAKHVFDYKDEKVIEKIKEAAPNLEHIFDTIGNETSSSLASKAFGDRQGNLCTVRPRKANTEQVTTKTHVTDVLVWTAFLKDRRYAHFYWPAPKEDHELPSELFDNLPSWLEQGKVKSNRTQVLSGLDSVPRGFQEHRDGTISAYKIVYEL
ncbi:uncharacterized protein N7459_007437, partial [Penicillium hispanicum]|uniref:uncharacterized protein n=1 Tax=Penicillium hispanicum TaxID=1080232 RepID=UPI0025409D52